MTTVDDGRAFLLGLDLRDRDVLVVGGGRVGTRRVRAFVDAGARVRVVAPTVTSEIDSLARSGRVDWAPREVTDDDLAGAWLVHTATGRPQVDTQVRLAAENRRIWCIDATDADRTAARIPARASVPTADGVVQVAVLTGEPRRSVRLRDRLVALLDAGVVPLRTRRTNRPVHPSLKEVS